MPCPTRALSVSAGLAMLLCVVACGNGPAITGPTIAPGQTFSAGATVVTQSGQYGLPPGTYGIRLECFGSSTSVQYDLRAGALTATGTCVGRQAVQIDTVTGPGTAAFVVSSGRIQVSLQPQIIHTAAARP